jgi:hypothetical protein
MRKDMVGQMTNVLDSFLGLRRSTFFCLLNMPFLCKKTYSHLRLLRQIYNWLPKQ